MCVCVCICVCICTCVYTFLCSAAESRGAFMENTRSSDMPVLSECGCGVVWVWCHMGVVSYGCGVIWVWCRLCVVSV